MSVRVHKFYVIYLNAGSYEVDLMRIASDLTDSVVASAIVQVMSGCFRGSELVTATDSGISFVEIPGHLSSGEDDELTVTGSKPHLAPTPAEAGTPIIPFSDLDKLGPVQTSSSIGVSVGRNDSQKSTTSSGYLGSGDEFVPHDWI
ncbi:unnamed protein product [Hydatigera taeniaeformis]|uniref:PPC domain-containing protein n=1 Tax=Hydatigena taeniaeformis TaxID=6205 RepID=A0A0R3WW27_HYDTA|nr:unnamed protein product [Hydatigera taeniaeformis]